MKKDPTLWSWLQSITTHLFLCLMADHTLQSPFSTKMRTTTLFFQFIDIFFDFHMTLMLCINQDYQNRFEPLEFQGNSQLPPASCHCGPFCLPSPKTWVRLPLNPPTLPTTQQWCQSGSGVLKVKVSSSLLLRTVSVRLPNPFHTFASGTTEAGVLQAS